MLATAEELISQGFNLVIDTALDGPDAKELAAIYFNRLNRDKILFVGIYCPTEERLNRLKTRSDNLFLTEEFIKLQGEKWNVFELCKDIYDIWFDSSLLKSEAIAEKNYR